MKSIVLTVSALLLLQSVGRADWINVWGSYEYGGFADYIYGHLVHKTGLMTVGAHYPYSIDVNGPGTLHASLSTDFFPVVDPATSVGVDGIAHLSTDGFPAEPGPFPENSCGVQLLGRVYANAVFSSTTRYFGSVNGTATGSLAEGDTLTLGISGEVDKNAESQVFAGNRYVTFSTPGPFSLDLSAFADITDALDGPTFSNHGFVEVIYDLAISITKGNGGGTSYVDIDQGVSTTASPDIPPSVPEPAGLTMLVLGTLILHLKWVRGRSMRVGA